MVNKLPPAVKWWVHGSMFIQCSPVYTHALLLEHDLLIKPPSVCLSMRASRHQGLTGDCFLYRKLNQALN
jgi:hypothetical protein